MFMILLAFFNGFLIITSRVVNAKLGSYLSGAGASFWNHLVGFLFLALIVPFVTNERFATQDEIPIYLFMGGLLGACYVAISSFVIPKIGATKATIFVIAGQIVLGTAIDALNGKISNLTISVVGISLVVLGVWVGNQKKTDVVKVCDA